jgi:hypothetical protein
VAGDQKWADTSPPLPFDQLPSVRTVALARDVPRAYPAKGFNMFVVFLPSRVAYLLLLSSLLSLRITASRLAFLL